MICQIDTSGALGHAFADVARPKMVPVPAPSYCLLLQSDARVPATTSDSPECRVGALCHSIVIQVLTGP
eukprot:scaffold22401_cov225-Isochrysis_galbana.AAC.1